MLPWPWPDELVVLGAPDWAQTRVLESLNLLAKLGQESGERMHPGLRVACLVAWQTRGFAFDHPALASVNPQGFTDSEHVYIPLECLGNEHEPMPRSGWEKLVELMVNKVGTAVHAGRIGGKRRDRPTTYFAAGFPSLGTTHPHGLLDGLQKQGAQDVINALHFSTMIDDHHLALLSTLKVLWRALPGEDSEARLMTEEWFHNVGYQPSGNKPESIASLMGPVWAFVERAQLDANSEPVQSRGANQRL